MKQLHKGQKGNAALHLRRPSELLHNTYFRIVWERASDAMAFSDADGIVLAANAAYLGLYGYSADEVIGHSFAIIFPKKPVQARSMPTRRSLRPTTPSSTPPARR